MTREPRITVGRVYEPRTSEADCRVLVDRLWPRGLTREAADLDEWCREVAPSTTLRRWYAHRPERFAEFRQRYLAELDDPEHLEAVRRLAKMVAGGPVTLLTAVRDLELGHVEVLAERLRSRHQPIRASSPPDLHTDNQE